MKHHHRLFCFGWIVLVLLVRPLLADDDGVPSSTDSDRPSSLARELAREPRTTRWQAANSAAVERAAKAGDSGARLELVRRSEAGEGRARDHDRALRELRTAAEAGDKAAQYWLGHYHADEEPAPGSNRFVGNYQLAAEWLGAAARQGHTLAAFELGELYHYGQLPRDTAEAIRWFTVAAEAGHSKAAANLAFHLAQGGDTAAGAPVRADPAAAIRWYQVAIERGLGDAAVALAELLSGDFNLGDHHQPADPVTARKWLLIAARHGHTKSKAVLAVVFDDTSTLREDDVPELINAQASAESAILVGRLFEEGRWVPKDLNEAVRFYQRAGGMSTNLMVARVTALVRLYASGEIKPSQDGQGPALPIDPAFVPAASVRLQLAELLWKGNAAVPRDRASAVEWFLLAAQAGSAPAMRRIGEFWEEGVNGKPDPAEAKRWYRRAELSSQAKPSRAK